MGLLDFLSSPEAATGIGLLAASGPRFDGAGFGQRLQEGLSYGQKQRDEEIKRKQALLEMEAFKRKEEIERLMMQQAVAKREALGNAWSPAQTQGSISIPSMGGVDMFSQGVKVGNPSMQTAPQLNVQALIKAGYTPKEIQELDSLRHLGKDEVTRTIKSMQGGREVEQQFDKYGQPVGQGLEQFKAPIMLDRGDRTEAVSPYTQPGVVFGKAQSPDSRMSNQVTMRGQNMMDARSREQFDFTKRQEGKPQLVDGQWVYKPTPEFPQGRVAAVPGITDKPLTESQGAATNFGMRSLKANQILTELENNGYGQAGNIKRFMTAATPGLGMGLDDSMGAMTNWTQSANQQMSEQAQLDFLTAVLRKESGASISPSEHITGKRQYFAQPGDSTEVLAQKQANRATAIEGLKMQAGPGAKNINPASNIPPQAVNDLKMRRGDPKAKAQFDAIFGTGAADRALGGN